MKRLLSITVILAFIMISLAACAGGSSSAPRSDAAAPAAPSAPPMEAYDAPSLSGDYNGETSGALPLPLLPPSDAESKKMVYTVDLRLQTTTFDEGTRKLINFTSEAGGYIHSAAVNGRSLYDKEDSDRSATYSLKIPSENLADFLVKIEDNYNLWSLEQVSEDITARYEQTDSRLSDLREQEQRLKEMIRQSTDADEKLILESELTDIQIQISSLTASKLTADNAVMYSTVTVRLFEVNIKDIEEEIKPTFSERLNKTTSASIEGVKGIGQGFVLLLISVVPILFVVLIIVLVVALLMRFWRRFGPKIKKIFPDKPAKQNHYPPPNSRNDSNTLNMDGQNYYTPPDFKNDSNTPGADGQSYYTPPNFRVDSNAHDTTSQNHNETTRRKDGDTPEQ